MTPAMNTRCPVITVAAVMETTMAGTTRTRLERLDR
jgi:hypothetical protein